MNDELDAAARRVAEFLQKNRLRIVFAESCTAGLVAASLGRVPGISEYLCGSAVVYRNETKTAWLGVPSQDLANEAIGPVSETVAAAMALGVLERTPEADWAASVTGHLGPHSPEGMDGLIYVGLARREGAERTSKVHCVIRHTLSVSGDSGISAAALRHLRQREATQFVLHVVASSDHLTA